MSTPIKQEASSSTCPDAPRKMSSDDLLEISSKLSELHTEVEISIKKIMGHKKTVRALYREFYVAKERLENELSKYKSKPEYQFFKLFENINDEEIFFEKKQKRARV